MTEQSQVSTSVRTEYPRYWIDTKLPRIKSGDIPRLGTRAYYLCGRDSWHGIIVEAVTGLEWNPNAVG